MRILHIEDSEILQRVIGRNLVRRFGCELTTVDNPEAAIAALQAGSFDIVVSDYNIIGGTGGQVLDWVRANKPGQPFMFLSDDDKIVSSGAPYLRKPASITDLCTAIEDIIK